MTIVNAALAREGVELTPSSDQLDFSIKDPQGLNGIDRYSWLTSGGDDVQVTGSFIDAQSPRPTLGFARRIEIDLSDNGVVTPDVVISAITRPDGDRVLALARLPVLTRGAVRFFDELMALGDAMTGSNHDDRFMAGGGDDTLETGAGNDFAFGDDGNDLLRGGDGDDRIFGGAGADRLDGGAGADTMDGGTGDDVYVVDDVRDVASEPAKEEVEPGGVDLAIATASHRLGANIEKLTLRGAADLLGSGNDLGNVIVGNAGGNGVSGFGGDDRLDLGGGDDNGRGDEGDDALNGGAGNDNLFGSEGEDVLNGGSGVDLLVGGDGTDRLVGGAGADTLVGGLGADLFDFDVAGHSVPAAADTIQGFDGAGAAAGDRIDLSGIDAVAGGGNDAFAFRGAVQSPFPPSLRAGSLYLRDEGDRTAVYGNVDADAAPELRIFVADGATAAGAYAAGDFVL